MRFAHRPLIFWSALLLFLLAGCGGAPAQPAAHAGVTPTPPASTPTRKVVPLHPPDHDPFQANFNESAPNAPCPASSRPTDLCFDVIGSGLSIPYGPISFNSFDTNFLAPGKGPIPTYSHNPGYCEPTTREGTITIGQDKALFTASGT